MKNIAIGIDVGGTNIRCGAVSEKGVLSEVHEPIRDKNSKKNTVSQIKNLVDMLYSKKIRGIGIGVPALVDVKTGNVYEAFNIPAWDSVPLKKILERRYKVPILVNNDANCFALGEKLFGCGKGYKNIVGIIMGTGFGAGIIIDGKIYSGKNGAAGEFGRVPLYDKTIEDYCSGKFFHFEYGVDGEETYIMAKKGDKNAISTFMEFGKNLGDGISVVVNSVDPELVVLGGSVSRAFRFFRKPMLEQLRKRTYKRVYQNIKIMASSLENAGIFGAAGLFF